MGSSFAVYDRDQNISGSVLPNSFVPEYGSSVTFEYKNPYYVSADNHPIKCSKNLNNTDLSFELKFTNKTEDEAKSFLHLLEGIEVSESGVLNFNTPNQSNVEIAFPTGKIYKNMSDFLVMDYNFTYKKNLFDIDLSLSKNGFSYFFDWSGSSYLNTGNFTNNINNNWIAGVPFEKFDIVYNEEYDLQNQDYHYLQVNRIEKFFYCKSGHISNDNNGPHGPDKKENWDQTFFFDIDDGVGISTTRDGSIYNDDYSFKSFQKKNGNDGLIKDLKISLNNRSDKETRAIIHFIEKHENARPFELSLPQLYTRKKFFIAKKMKHTFVYKNCNNIQIELDEIVKFKNDQLLDSYYVY